MQPLEYPSIFVKTTSWGGLSTFDPKLADRLVHDYAAKSRPPADATILTKIPFHTLNDRGGKGGGSSLRLDKSWVRKDNCTGEIEIC